VLSETFKVTFVLAMPDSWSKKKRALLDGQPHRQKPDIDNLLKFIMDALLPNGDECVHEISARKIWGVEGKVIIEQHDNIEDQARIDPTNN
jgi:Holliday junction resolvase RusA-like endonuclease